MPETLTALREALGWSQEEAARHAGFTQPIVSAIERGRGSPHRTAHLRLILESEIAQRRENESEARAATEMARLAAAMPDSPEWQALRAAIKERALDYLERCQPVACDALLEMIPTTEAGELLSNFLDPPDATATPPDPTTSVDGLPAETATPPTLADRIDAFLARYARIRASYVPGEDDPEERFNGPDTAMLASASGHIRAGRRPHTVHSDWSMSGCYRIPTDPEEARQAADEHTTLVAEINALAREA